MPAIHLQRGTFLKLSRSMFASRISPRLDQDSDFLSGISRCFSSDRCSFMEEVFTHNEEQDGSGLSPEAPLGSLPQWMRLPGGTVSFEAGVVDPGK